MTKTDVLGWLVALAICSAIFVWSFIVASN
jgi:hypothetical protein